MERLTQEELDKRLESHKIWHETNGENGEQLNLYDCDISGLCLQNADMRYANMQYANMQNADMRYANIDFSCWPLWCGSASPITDKKQKKQLGYHFAALLDDNDPEEKALKNVLQPFVNDFHRVKTGECKKI